MELASLEALALADDRDAALSDLVPGTEDHDWWRAVRLQNLGNLDAVDPILQHWKGRHGDTARRRTLEQRQLLLRADRDLAGSTRRLAHELDAVLDHQPEIEAESARHPTQLDPALLDDDRLLDEALRNDHSLGTVTNEALPALLGRTLDTAQRRQLLTRLQRTGLPGLVKAIAQDLVEKSSKGFGSLRIHHQLTRAELADLVDLVPDLRHDRNRVLATLVRCRPPVHVDIELDPAERAAWLDALWAQVEGLPPSYRSLQVHVLYHRLAVDVRTGVLDRDRLLRYLALPRQTSYMTRGWADIRDLGALNEDFSASTGLATVYDDEPLVRTLLARLLETGDGAEVRPFVDRRWLDVLLAETRLLAGDTDEQWPTILGPAATTALRDRVDLELLPTNRRVFGRDEPVVLHVAIKNPDLLRIRVFRLDVAAHFQARGTDVALAIDLDGLAAGWEEVRKPTVAPMRRVVERIALPACDRPGTWVVELVGNGRASRALVRKGDLRAVTRPTPGGLAVTVLDEGGRTRPEASLLMGGRAYRAREDGAISLPFSTRPGELGVLLLDGELAVPTTLRLPAEQYALSAACWLDRQSLSPGRTASCVVRLDLTVDGSPTPLSILDEPWVEITVKDRTGVPAVRRETPTLGDERDLVLAIAIPEHLTELAIAVGGRVRVVSEQRTIDLRHDVSIDVGTIHQTDATGALYLGRAHDGWSLYWLGKNGEPRPGASLPLALTTRWVTTPVEVTLATDEHGRIALGPMPQVTGLRAMPATGRDQTFDLAPPIPQVQSAVHACIGDEVLIPVRVGVDGESLRPDEWSVVELRGDAPAMDGSVFGVAEPGVLRLRGLPAGEHRVAVPGAVVAVRVLPTGPSDDDSVALPTLTVEVPPAPPVLTSATVTGDGIDLHVANAGPLTRVHLLATALWPTPAGSEDLATTLRPPGLRPHQRRESQYVSGRDIGDEYRYVLDRRHQPRRPGTMLDRPPLLLNPWALRTTETAVKAPRGGAEWANAPAPAQAGGGGARYPGLGQAVSASAGSDAAYLAFDFLGSPPVVIAGLRPDDDGRLHVSRALLGDAQVVEVVVVDPGGTATRTVALPHRGLAVRDLRLSAALPADRHLREDRRLVPLGAGAVLEIADRATTRIELVDTVGKLYRALCALGNDADLATWEFLSRWGSLSRPERLVLYAKHACHELSLFVYFKDRPLFDEIVRPYVANKLQPTFVDQFLLERDLSAWLDPRRLARLNAVERALLARRMPEMRAAIARFLGDRVELVAPDPERDDRLVNTFLAGGALSGEGGEMDLTRAATVDAFGADLDLEAEEASEVPRSAARSRAPAAPAGMAKRMSKHERTAALDRADRGEKAPLYRSADKTQEWAEHNWWHKRVAEQGPELIPASRLWRDLASHVEGPFLSPAVADAAQSFAASVCALAVIDLPFTATATTVASRGSGATIRAGSHLYAAVAALTGVEGPPTGEILVGQSTFRSDDRFEWDGAERREKYVTGERLIGVAYTGQVVVTNPTSRTVRLAVLVQIPAGSVPVGGSVPTRTDRVLLAPHSTDTLEFSYTFPSEGTFAQYGAQVICEDVLVAAVASETVTVVRTPTTSDAASWAHVSQRGSLDDVLAYLSRENLARVDLGRMAWRLRERDAFEQITAALVARQVYDDTVWAYALFHADRARAAEWLAHRDGWLAGLGPLRTSLCTVDPVERGLYQHLEYAPLVNARAHQLGERRTVLNDGLLSQWRAFLERVATEASPAPDDWLAAAHYLFAMDRPDDAIRALSRAPLGEVDARLQHDYLTAYAAASSGDLGTARARSTPHAAHPVDRWRHRFAALIAMLDEVDGGVRGTASDPDSRDARMGELAAQQPALAAKIESDHVVLDHRNLERATLRFHRMDIELLFSRQPFLGAGGDRFSFIDPGVTVEVTLDPGGRTRTPFPAELARVNVVIEVVAGPLRQTVTHLAHDLAVAVAAPYGQLQVRRASTGTLLPAAYVKAYARKGGGQVDFYKDGYTDLRGRLDYATLSTDDLDRVERFALLVVHDEAGSTVIEADPPVR